MKSSEWRISLNGNKKALKKERDFLIKLKKTYQACFQPSNSLTARSVFNGVKGGSIDLLKRLGNATTSDNKSNTKDAYENVYDILKGSGTKRHFVKFSQAHQGVFKYVTQKNKMK